MIQNQQILPWVPMPLAIPTIVDDRDLFISNTTSTPGTPGPPGPEGPPGPPGKDGVSVTNAKVEPNPGDLIITLSDGTEINAGNVIGPPGTCTCASSICNTTLVTKDYSAKLTDYYIGVNVTKPTNIILPSSPSDCTTYIIKLEMSSPVGNRKVTVKGNGKLIDGQSSVVLENPYECLNIIYRGDGWHIISNYK